MSPSSAQEMEILRFFLKLLYFPRSQAGFATQKTSVDIFTAVRTSDFITLLTGTL